MPMWTSFAWCVGGRRRHWQRLCVWRSRAGRNQRRQCSSLVSSCWHRRRCTISAASCNDGKPGGQAKVEGWRALRGRAARNVPFAAGTSGTSVWRGYDADASECGASRMHRHTRQEPHRLELRSGGDSCRWQHQSRRRNSLQVDSWRAKWFGSGPGVRRGSCP